MQSTSIHYIIIEQRIQFQTHFWAQNTRQKAMSADSGLWETALESHLWISASLECFEHNIYLI